MRRGVENGEEGDTSAHTYGNTDALKSDSPESGERLYGNIPASSNAKPTKKNGRPPVTAPRPSANASRGNVYENVQLSGGAGRRPEVPPKPIADSRVVQKTDEYEEEEDVYNTEDLYACYNTVSTKPQLDALQKYLLEALASGDLSSQFGGCRGEKQYIATQGPRDTHVNDLWWMVWQEKATQVVMLTNLIEDGKDKCEEYWPAAGKTQTYGHVTVRGLEVEERADFVIRPFMLKVKGAGERQVTQYHFNTWPDHGVPQASALVDFWRYVKARGNPSVPLIVHCSAGVGRTGTFIALDIASELEAGGREVNVQQIVIELREQRCIMVQSEMLEEMGKYRPKRSYRMANMKENVVKNRNQDAIPDGSHVNTIVSIGSKNEEETVENYCQFWPPAAAKSIATGPYVITLVADSVLSDHLVSHTIRLTQKSENKVREVQLLHYSDWAGELPDDMSGLIQLVDTVKAEDDASSPIVIQCIILLSFSDGAAKSGLFCAIYDIINRLTYDDEIDVYMTARYVQSIRPQAVSTEAQYRYLYKVAQEYISHLSVYQNTNVRA
nr:hypothetical protein BaRGS_000845 [Batillaria attramentaria]